jgi:ABC-type transport system substrate-binding protein
MKAHIGLLLILFSLPLLFILSCSKDSKPQFEHAGGTIRMALDNEPSTYDPRNVLDYYSATVLYQIAEGLVGMDPANLKITPKIASDWSISDDGLEYTFTIRDDVYFHSCEKLQNEDDRKLRIEDIIASFEAGCKKDEKGVVPAAYSLVFSSISGAEEFMNGKAKSISGLKGNGSKLTIKMIKEDSNFLYKLANINAAISCKRILDEGLENELVIGTGPFKYDKLTGDETTKLILLKNEDYYLSDDKGNALPYLDSIVFIFQSRKMDQLDMFESGKIDVIKGLPTSRITRMLEGRIKDFNSKPPRLILQNNPLLETNFYYFNLMDPRFKDPRVRKAFNYAIDKEMIGREILRNQYYDLGWYGITPPVSRALKGYDFKEIKESSYDYNPELAKQLLAEAGYKNGEGFGSVTLRFNINDIHSAVADEFAKQIYNTLGINVNIDGSTFEQLIEDGEIGNGAIFRQGWGADYPSPETFLTTFYGKYVPKDSTERSRINKARYVNPKFDNFYSKATAANKLSDQMIYFMKAEVELMKDPPIIPLWYSGDIEIIYSYVRNFHFNPLNHIDFTSVYLKEWTEEEYQKKTVELQSKE